MTRPKSKVVRTPHIIHPDYKAWRRLHVGMSQYDVRTLLGQPLKVCGDSWHYGHLRFPSSEYKETFKFALWFDRHGELFLIEQPFQPALPTDGRPTKPTVHTPLMNAEFCHYPRFFDVRWSPSAGRYPMAYELELSHEFDRRFHDPYVKTGITTPGAVELHCGAQRGKLRVRAVNELGKSRWSDPVLFGFAV